MSLLTRYKIFTETPKSQPSLRARMGHSQLAIPPDQLIKSDEDRTFGGQAVRNSRDLTRILELPEKTTGNYIAHYSQLLGKPNPNCECKTKFNRQCVKELHYEQAQALHEVADPTDRAGKAVGLFAPLAVGSGKTLLDLLSPLVVPNCKRAVLLIPPQLRAQLLTIDWPFYAQHWRLPNLAGARYFNPALPTVHVISYSELSSAKSTDLLEKLQPDLIIADEGHCFPAGTRVSTPTGTKAIEDIRWGDEVLSFTKSRTVLIRKVTALFRKFRPKRMVKVTHERGYFICTPEHKIWTTERGYIEAQNLSKIQDGESVPSLSSDFSDNEKRVKYGSVLFSKVCGGSSDNSTAPSEHPYKSKNSTKDKEGRASASVSSVQTTIYSSAQNQDLLKEVRSIADFRTNANKQPYEESSYSGENDSKPEGADISISRRQWSPDRAATIVSKAPKSADGVCYSYQGCTLLFREPASLLQSRLSLAGTFSSNRSRWEDTSQPEMEISRQEEDRGFIGSRVVSVEILEQGGNGGYGESSERDSFVYDIEVENEHNYIADGVAVSNCVRNRTAARTKRFLRYFHSRPGTRFLCWSGTLTSKSLKDYCLIPGTKVLTADLVWKPIEQLIVGEELIGFDEGLGRKGHLQSSFVQGTKVLNKPSIKITTTRGTVTCSKDHQWVLCCRDGWRKTRHWIEASEVLAGDELAFFSQTWEYDETREAGYLAGLLDGEGWISEPGQIGFGQKPGPIMDRYCKGLKDRGFTHSYSEHKTGVPRVIPNGENPHMRLLGMLRPTRLMQKSRLTWDGKMPWGKNTEKAVVLSVEDVGEKAVIAVQTSTKTLIAEGFLTHNCHLAELALGEGSPVPLHYPEVEAWAAAIDPSDWPAPIGELRKLCEPGEHVRDGFRRRMLSTKGVVATTAKGGCNAALVITRRDIPVVPMSVVNALNSVGRTWTRPDGEELVDSLSWAACMRQLACGFYYRWVYPRGEAPELIKEWFTKRQDWHRELREKLKHPRVHLDSPLLCTKAAIRAEQGYVGELPVWHSDCWAAWRDIRASVEPQTATVWVDDWLARDAAVWAKENTGIVWILFKAFGEKVAELSDKKLYAGGREASEGIILEDGSRSIIASANAYGQGFNLQMFSRALIANMSPSGALHEQLAGRLHRTGQIADEVVMDVYLHTDEVIEAFRKARRDAEYIQQSFGSPQKLCMAQYIEVSEIELLRKALK